MMYIRDDKIALYAILLSKTFYIVEIAESFLIMAKQQTHEVCDIWVNAGNSDFVVTHSSTTRFELRTELIFP